MAKKAYVWDGSSWISISSTITDADSILPLQTGNSGKFLTTNGSSVSWGTVDLTPYATTANPALTGTPTAPTAAVDTNTTQIATTSFVIGQAGSANPIVDGTAAAGTSIRYSRQDHVHPTDTSRAALASPTFTGTPAAPTPTLGTNSTRISTTEFVSATIDNEELLIIAGAL